MKKTLALLTALICLAGCSNNTSETTSYSAAVTEKSGTEESVSETPAVTITAEENNEAEKKNTDFEYAVYAGMATIQKYIGSNKDITVPAEIDGIPVGKIEPKLLYESNVETLTFEDGITKIPHLSGCKNLKVINLPATTETVEDFQYCPSLEQINIPENKYYKSVDGVLYSRDGTVLTAFPLGRTGSFKMPDDVKIISDHTFQEAKISEITFSENLEEIGDYAFRRCADIREITLPESLKYIGFGAFMDSSLLKVNISEGIEEIQSRAFSGTELTELYLPSTITEYGVNVTENDVKISASYPVECLKQMWDSKNVTFRDENTLQKAIRKLRYNTNIHGRILIDINGDNFPECADISRYGDIYLAYFDIETDNWVWFSTNRYMFSHTSFVDGPSVYYLIYSEEFGEYVYCSDIYNATYHEYSMEYETYIPITVQYQDIIRMADGKFSVHCYKDEEISLKNKDIIKTLSFDELIADYGDIDKYEDYIYIHSDFADEPNGEIKQSNPLMYGDTAITQFPYFEKKFTEDVSIKILGRDILRGEEIEGVRYEDGVLYLNNAVINGTSEHKYMFTSTGFNPLTIDITGECYLLGNGTESFFNTYGTAVEIQGDGTLYTTKTSEQSIILKGDVKLVEYNIEKYNNDIFNADYVRSATPGYYIKELSILDNASLTCLKTGGNTLYLSGNSQITCDKMEYKSILVEQNSSITVGGNEGKAGQIQCSTLKIRDDGAVEIISTDHEALRGSADGYYRKYGNLSISVTGNGTLNVIGRENKTAVYAAYEYNAHADLTLSDNAQVTIRNGKTAAIFNCISIYGGILDITADSDGQAVKFSGADISANPYLQEYQKGLLLYGDIKKIQLDDTVKNMLSEEEKTSLKYNCQQYSRIYIEAEAVEKN